MRILKTSLIFLAAIMVSKASLAQDTLKNQIVGTWRMVSWEQVSADGKVELNYGKTPVGVHFFDANGNFFYMASRPDMPKNKSPMRRMSTDAENRLIVDGSHAFWGTYKIDEASKTLILNVTASTFPNQVGEGRRTITVISPNELHYSNQSASGVNRHVFKK